MVALNTFPQTNRHKPRLPLLVWNSITTSNVDKEIQLEEDLCQ